MSHSRFHLPTFGWQKTTKRLLGAATLLLFGVTSSMIVSASGPAQATFNDQTQDYPTVMVAAPGGQWGTSLNVKAGDLVDVAVWDHETTDIVALNVKLQTQLPSGFTVSPTITGSVSASNGVTANGQATLNSNGVPVQLAFLSGTPQLYRNVNGALTPVQWPNGINGDDIVGNGVVFPQQEFCWQNAQLVTYQVRVGAGSPVVAVHKDAQLSGGAPYSPDPVTNAQPGDIIGFRIKMDNTGTATGTGTTITDPLSPKLSYLGNAYVTYKNGNTDKTDLIPDSQVTVSGQNVIFHWKDMPADEIASFYFGFQTKVAAADQFPVGQTTLQNCAIGSFTNASAVTSNCVQIIVNKSQTPVITFTVQKRVMDLTSGLQKWYDHNNPAFVAPGDVVTYQIQALNTGNVVAQNVKIQDLLPAGLVYQPGTAKLFNHANQNGIAINDDIVNGGYTFASITNGNLGYEYIQFNAQIPATCSNNGLYTNNVNIIYNGQVAAHDSVDTNVTCHPGLTLVKSVKDPVDGLYKHQATGIFHASDTVTYRMTIANTGNSTIMGAQLSDVLPADVTYVPGSLLVDGVAETRTDVQKALFAGGISLPTLEPGHTKEIYITVQISACPNGDQLGNTVLTNTAHVNVPGMTQLTDTAVATVHVDAPLAPKI